MLFLVSRFIDTIEYRDMVARVLVFVNEQLKLKRQDDSGEFGFRSNLVGSFPY